MKRLTAAAIAFVIAAPAAHAVNLVTNGDFSQFAQGPGAGYTFRSSNNEYVAWTQNVISGNNGGLILTLASAALDATDNVHDGGASYSLWNTTTSPAGPDVITAPPSGNATVFAQDSAPENTSYLSQTVSGLTAGKSYVVTFNWAGAQLEQDGGSNWNGATNEAVEVNFGGAYDGGTSQSFTGGQTVFATAAGSYTGTVAGAEAAGLQVPEHGFVGWKSATLKFTANAASEVLNLEAVSSSTGSPPFAVIDNVQLLAVPEPATWALMVIGVAGLGGMARRRRAVVAAV